MTDVLFEQYIVKAELRSSTVQYILLLFNGTNIIRGPSIKDACTNRKKLTSSPLVRTGSIPSSLIRADTPYISKYREFLHQKVRPSASEEPPPLSAKCSHWTTLPRHPLWTTT